MNTSQNNIHWEKLSIEIMSNWDTSACLIWKNTYPDITAKLKKSEEDPFRPVCNCSGSLAPCPLNGNCQVTSVVYKATVVDSDNTTNTYTGLTSNTFKWDTTNIEHHLKKKTMKIQQPSQYMCGTWRIKTKILKLSGVWSTELQTSTLPTTSADFALKKSFILFLTG